MSRCSLLAGQDLQHEFLLLPSVNCVKPSYGKSPSTGRRTGAYIVGSSRVDGFGKDSGSAHFQECPGRKRGPGLSPRLTAEARSDSLLRPGVWRGVTKCLGHP